MTEEVDLTFVETAADIVASFVSNNTVRADELPDLIQAVYGALKTLAEPKPEVVVAPAPTPAVPVRKSITDDYLICLEDGKKFRSLKRHLATDFGMTPEQYRAKWGLPRDYPMVAPGYAAKRSALAKASGLGSSRRGIRSAEAAAPAPAPAPAVMEEPAPAPSVAPRKAAAKRTKAPAPVENASEAAPPAAEPAKRRTRTAKKAA